jgi:Fe-S-cluster containining protein
MSDQDTPAARAARAAAGFALRPDEAACEALSERIVRELTAEFSAASAAGAPIACVAGCTFCCHQRVNVFPHEAVAIVRRLRKAFGPDEQAAIEQRILDNARRVDALTPGQHRSANLRCALLVEGQCSVYDVRPSACAAYHSLSRDRCRHSFEHPESIGTPRNSRPALRPLQEAAASVAAALETELRGAGLRADKGELHQRLRAALEQAGEPSSRHRACEPSASEPSA